MKKIIFSAVLALIMGPVLASASTCSGDIGSPLLVDVNQTITNDPDSGNHGYWAMDNYQRHIRVWKDADGSTYCTQVDYNGTFNAPTGVLSPQNGNLIGGTITGTMVGGYHASITGTMKASSSIPTSVDYQGVLSTGDRPGYVSWLDAAFEEGYDFHYLNNDTDWSWTYKAGGSDSQSSWTNAGAGSSGDITPVFDISSKTGYATLQAAINAATAGDTIVLSADATTTAQINVNKALTIEGNGHTIYANFTKTDNDNNSAIGVGASTVTIKNITLDGKSGGQVKPLQLHGINVYLSNGVTLGNVTIKDFGGAAIVVNGSDVTATNLTTSNNVWGAVNVDPGLDVTGTSTFTLVSGSLGENKQIWSDGDHVSAMVPVVVNAIGYNKYLIGGTTASFVWSNRPVTQQAMITKGGVSTLYSTIQAAILAAEEGDTVKVYPGNYNIVHNSAVTIEGQSGWYLPITKNSITLQGVDSAGNDISSADNVAAYIYSVDETPNGAWASQNLMTVFGDNVSIKGLGIMNKISPNKGIEVVGNNFTAQNDVFLPIPVTLLPTVANYTDTDGSTHNDISKYGSGIYFNNNGATTSRTGTVSGNVFKNSGITFDSFKDNWTVTISNNTFDGNKIWTDGTGSTYYSAIGATTWETPPQLDFTGSTISIHGNKFLNMADGQQIVKIKSTMTGSYNAGNNYWGTDSSTTIASLVADSVDYVPWYVNPGLTILNTNISGSTASVSEPVVNFQETVDGTVSLPSGVSTLALGNDSVLSLASSTNEKSGTDIVIGGATTSLSSFAVEGTMTPVNLTLAQTVGGQTLTVEKAVTLSSGSSSQPIVLTNSTLSTVSVSIPDSTTILAPSGWNGTITPPKTVSATGAAPSGFVVGSTVIDVGSPDTILLFNKPVIVTLSGVTGSVGYKSAGSGQWVKIDTTCTGTYANPTGAVFPGECAISDGVNTKILTYHFTSFGALATAPAPVVSGGGYFVYSNAPASIATVTATSTATTTGQVLGEQTSTVPGNRKGMVLGAKAYSFSRNLRFGVRGSDVAALQQMLMDGGYMRVASSTTYFGPITKAAVIRWQKKMKLPATGYFGPLSRAVVMK